jgi:hypothetical protein
MTLGKDLSDRPRLVCCEDGWMDLVEKANFGVSNDNSVYFNKKYLHISVLTLIASSNLIK